MLVGDTVMEAVVAPPGLHKYVGELADVVAVSVTLSPLQIVAEFTLTDGDVSSFVMVPVPCALAIVAPTAPDRFTNSVSLNSHFVSPTIGTVIVCVSVSGGKFSVPLTA